MHLSHRRRIALALAATLAAGLTPPAAPAVAAAGAERVPASATAQPTPGLAPAAGPRRTAGSADRRGGGAPDSPLLVLAAAGAVLATATGCMLGLREATKRPTRDVAAATDPPAAPAAVAAPAIALPAPAARSVVARTRHRELYEAEYALQLERLRALRHRHERKT